MQQASSNWRPSVSVAADLHRRTDSGGGEWADYSAYSPTLPEYDAITWLGIGLAIVANALIAVLDPSLHSPRSMTPFCVIVWFCVLECNSWAKSITQGNASKHEKAFMRRIYHAATRSRSQPLLAGLTEHPKVRPHEERSTRRKPSALP